jgi:hypothetical protein
MLQMKKHTTAKIATIVASLAAMAAAFGLVQSQASGTATADTAAASAPATGASRSNAAPANVAATKKTKSAQPLVRAVTRTHVS